MEAEPINELHESAMALRGVAFANTQFLRVVHTGQHLQAAVMSIPPDGEMGSRSDPGIDRLFAIIDGTAEARVGELALALLPGDVVFVEAGKRHNLFNRATIPLRLVSFSAPPALPDGTVWATAADEPAGSVR